MERQPAEPADGFGQPVRKPIDRAEVEDSQPAVRQQPEVARMRIRVQEADPAGTGVQEPHEQQPSPVAFGGGAIAYDF